MIIETTCNRLYRVDETGVPGLEHVWYGSEVTKKKFRPKKNAKRELVRKEACRIVLAATIEETMRYIVKSDGSWRQT